MDLKFKRPNRYYEGIVIVHPDATESDQKKLFKKNNEIIKNFKGEVVHLDNWGKRRLGNPINRFKMGNYFHTTFEAGTECVAELERTMRINDKVLRFLHVHLDERKPLSKHLEEYRDIISRSNKREQEREAKNQARKSSGGFKRTRRDAVSEED